jgi:CheY-like chemotaxis protein
MFPRVRPYCAARQQPATPTLPATTGRAKDLMPKPAINAAGKQWKRSMGARDTKGITAEPSLLLVVDDEAIVRMVIADFLRGAGFLVMEATTADDAVAMLRRHQDIRLVLTDVLMPGALNGFDLAEWIEHHRPDVRVLLTSGYFSEVNLPTRVNWSDRLIRKPYRLSEISDRIKALLAKPDGDA